VLLSLAFGEEFIFKNKDVHQNRVFLNQAARVLYNLFISKRFIVVSKNKINSS